MDTSRSRGRRPRRPISRSREPPRLTRRRSRRKTTRTTRTTTTTRTTSDEEDEVSVEERARADAEARRRRLQSTKRRRADEVACAFAAVTASQTPSVHERRVQTPRVVRLVRHGRRVRRRPRRARHRFPDGGGGGAFRHMSGVTERAREISRHRLQLQRESKRCRAEVEAHATELTRRRFGCGLRSAPNPPVGSFGRGRRRAGRSSGAPRGRFPGGRIA